MTNKFCIYLHIPFCLKKCPYCDFNSYDIHKHGFPEKEYVAALCEEIDLAAGNPMWQGRNFKTIFFGGGTPSLLGVDSFATILSQIKRSFPAQNCEEQKIETTIEANPGTLQEDLSANKLSALRSLGINRISLGVQSFSPKKLQALGRWHTPQEIIYAINNIKEAGFDNFNLDLIFGTAEETIAEWTTDLNTALSLSPTHISAYCLTIEPGTEFAKLHKKNLLQELSAETQAQMYQQTVDILAAKNYQRYEISNYAQVGKECEHNLNYWLGTDYLGLGAGACSFNATTNQRWTNLPKPAHYIKAIYEKKSAIQLIEELTLQNKKNEFFFLRLRTINGASLQEYRDLFGEDLFTEHQCSLQKLLQQGLILSDENRIYLSNKGFLFANSVFEELMLV